ncbi:GNAT family N-acetyltransferase, variant 2 [Balamuthia mandrillaris]
MEEEEHISIRSALVPTGGPLPNYHPSLLVCQQFFFFHTFDAPQKDDVAAIREVNWRCLKSERYNDRMIEDHLEASGHLCFVARAGKKGHKSVVGYVLTEIDPTEQRYKQGYVVSLAVLPEFRRRGIASRLLAATSAALLTQEDASRVALTVSAANEAAQHFYKAQGFK